METVLKKINSTRTHFSVDVNALPLAVGGNKSLIFIVNFLLYLSIRTVR